MPWRTFLKLTRKALRFAISRPIQRFNIENRAKDHLGVDAKYFKPAPRITAPSSQPAGPLLTARDEKLITGASKLEVTKQITITEPNCDTKQKQHRPLPTSTNLPLQDPTAIWVAKKIPPGRLDLNKLQELMLNKLADDEFWSPKVIADKYKIKEEYAASLTKYLKQIRIRVSPRMARALDTVGLHDEYYQAAKHIVYHVDNSLRNEFDRQFDEMYLPNEQLDPEVKEVLEPFSKQLISKPGETSKKLVKRPEPLRISALNQRHEEESSPALNGRAKLKLDAPKDSSKSSANVT